MEGQNMVIRVVIRVVIRMVIRMVIYGYMGFWKDPNENTPREGTRPTSFYFKDTV